MRKTALFCAIVLALGGAAVADAAGSGTRSHTTTTLHFHEPASNSSFVDVGGKGTTQGDFLAWDDQLRDVDTGKFVGRVAGVCTLVDLRSQLFDCSPVTYLLPGGTIYVDGLFSGKGTPETDPIVGGTGKYDGVHGTAIVKALSATLDDHVLNLSS
jgi:hypothetical protein